MDMPTLEARRTPRVDYHGVVELLPCPNDDAHDVHEDAQPLSAEALDLGEGGMRVAINERLPLGSQWTCKLTLDGRAAALTGRVAWLRAHTSPRPHGVGICFDALPSYERSLLAHVVERTHAGYRPVQVQFAGLPEPIVARALPQASGLKLSAALPILDRGTSVSVRLEEDGPLVHGQIGAVTLGEHGDARRLEIELDLGAAETEGVRFRRRARYGLATELGAEAQAGNVEAASTAQAAALATERAPEPTRSMAAPHRARLTPAGR